MRKLYAFLGTAQNLSLGSAVHGLIACQRNDLLMNRIQNPTGLGEEELVELEGRCDQLRAPTTTGGASRSSKHSSVMVRATSFR